MTTILAILAITIVSLAATTVIAAYLEPSPADLLEVEIADALDFYLECHDDSHGASQAGASQQMLDVLADERDRAWERYRDLCDQRLQLLEGGTCNAKQRES